VDIGTTLRQRDRFLGRRLELTVQVVDYEPIHKVTLQTTSRGLSFAGSWRLS
jgi:hypothetical protein